MEIKKYGFRGLYHNIGVLELNDVLREVIRDCPDANKATHAVVYGYIDSETGMMLEVLGAGKQATKYFYFREPYVGKRITLSISEVTNVEFDVFTDLDPKVKGKYAPRIEELSKYSASKEVEKSREFEFLDELRNIQFPDDIRVVLVKEGMKTEECWVRINGFGNHCIQGILLNQPYQNFGVNRRDIITFGIEDVDADHIKCVADFNEHEIVEDESEYDDILKGAINEFFNDQSEENLDLVLNVLRNCDVSVPCEMNESSDEEGSYFPIFLEGDQQKFIPVFSNDDEIGGELPDDTSVVVMPFMQAMDMAMEVINEINGILVNPFTDSFNVDKELFGTIRQLEPLDSEEENEQLTDAAPAETFVDKNIGLDIRVGKMDVFNYALYQNDIKPIRDIELHNISGSSIDGLILRITSDFDFFKEYEAPLPTIPSGKPVRLEDPQLIKRKLKKNLSF